MKSLEIKSNDCSATSIMIMGAWRVCRRMNARFDVFTHRNTKRINFNRNRYAASHWLVLTAFLYAIYENVCMNWHWNRIESNRIHSNSKQIQPRKIYDCTFEFHWYKMVKWWKFPNKTARFRSLVRFLPHRQRCTTFPSLYKSNEFTCLLSPIQHRCQHLPQKHFCVVKWHLYHRFMCLLWL